MTLRKPLRYEAVDMKTRFDLTCRMTMVSLLGPLGLLFACAPPPPDETPPIDERCAKMEPAIPAPPLHTPRWAFSPWISKDISTTQDTYDFVDGFRSRDIPVGAVVLDSPWETQYNTFQPSPTRYPQFQKLVTDMHQRGVRVVLWITPLTNSASFDLETGGDKYAGAAENFQPAKDCKFFVNDGETYVWWKGQGAAIDFFNSAARAFWHQQQDTVLDAGIDGWKLDFGESYIATEPLATAAGEKTLQEYSEEYYRDFLSYGVQRRGREFVTMVRAYDQSYQLPGRFYARPEHAPVGWMGDNRRDFVGFADALNHMFVSARAGYAVLGSDIGGYLDVDDQAPTGPHIPYNDEAFLRWTAVGALTPFMQLHGRANLTPWTVPTRVDETVAAYRYFAKLHEQLVPFFYSLAEEAHGRAILFPQGDEATWAGDYRYVLGEALLVAPILDGSGRRDVKLPTGARWADFFQLSAVYAGGSTVASYDARSAQRLPLFLREGAIVPLEVLDDSTGLGNRDSNGAQTVLMFPGSQRSTFRLHEVDDSITEISAQYGSQRADITLDRAPRRLILWLRLDEKPLTVKWNGAALTQAPSYDALSTMASGYATDPTRNLIFIKVPAGASAQRGEITTGP